MKNNLLSEWGGGVSDGWSKGQEGLREEHQCPAMLRGQNVVPKAAGTKQPAANMRIFDVSFKNNVSLVFDFIR